MCYGCQQVLADLQETDGLHTAADHQRRHQVMQTAAVGPQKIYRGISVNPWSGGETSDALRELLAPGSWGQPDIDPAKLAHPDLGPALLNHVAHGNWSEWGNFRGKRPQLGRHWTTDKRIAQGFGGSGGITTVLEADHPGDVGLDPKNTGVRGRGDRSNYGHEQEVTLKPGTPLNITHVHVRHPTGWYTHDMGVSKMARAASYEVPEPWQRYYDHMSAQPDTSGNAHLMMPTDLVHQLPRVRSRPRRPELPGAQEGHPGARQPDPAAAGDQRRRHPRRADRGQPPRGHRARAGHHPPAGAGAVRTEGSGQRGHPGAAPSCIQAVAGR
ncbi:hypothetical protein SEA_BABYLAND_82 [Mycobacterium phage Babyland]|nr:hypothetical protein SEA_BABYLAND_82 [Mycobacterium phage Babyland]